jgi:hypothetical protein
MAQAAAGSDRRPPLALAVVILAAVTLAALGAGLGGWLGWRDAPALPDDTSAVWMVETLAPRGTPAVVERHDATFGYVHPRNQARLVGSGDYTAGYVKVLLTGGEDAATLITEIRDQLAVTGWQISGNLIGAGTAATKGRLAVRVYPATLDGQRLSDVHPDDAVALEIGRNEPGRVQPFTIIGYLLGLALGWFVAAWVVERLGAGAGGRLAAGLGILGLLLLLPGTVLTTGDLVYSMVLIPGSMPSPPAWGQYLLPGVRALSTAGLVLLPAAVAASAAPAALRTPSEGS